VKSLMDDAARILAGPLPRREALRFVGKALFGGVMGMFLLGCGCTKHCTNSGETAYCVSTNTCCPTGYTLSCGGLCYMGASGSCPSNLPQQSLCSEECT
jgi:hypothetical protein